MIENGQRRHRRFELRDVKGSLLFRTQVKLRNVSVAGLSFETTERLKLGRNYSLRLTNTGESVDLCGTIRWCHLAGRRLIGGDSLPVYEAGLAFDDVFTEKAEAVIRFIEQHVVLPLDKRITGRFTLETLESVDIEARYEFEVLELSGTGMLVKTQLEAPVDSRFGMEVGLPDEMLSIRGRVAAVKRVGAAADAQTELAIEFEGLDAESRTALSRFIAEQVE